jgi:hypothetical protein
METDEPEWFEPIYEVPTTRNREHEEPSDAALMHAAIAVPPPSIKADIDAMEDDEHNEIFVGTLPPLPPSSSEASPSEQYSSASSSTSGGTKDTQELIQKLSTNPYLPLISKLNAKKKVKNDELSGSQDSASHHLSDQDSGVVLDHHHTNTSGEASVTQEDAGSGD